MDVWDIAVYLIWSLLGMGLLFFGLVIMAGYIMGEIYEEMIAEAEREVGS